MLESTKEDATGLPEGSDIGLGAGGREFESCHSDQEKTAKIRQMRRFFAVFSCLLIVLYGYFCTGFNVKC